MAESSILMRLDGLKIKYEELGQKLTDPEVIADVKAFVQYNKEYRELEPIIITASTRLLRLLLMPLWTICAFRTPALPIFLPKIRSNPELCVKP